MSLVGGSSPPFENLLFILEIQLLFSAYGFYLASRSFQRVPSVNVSFSSTDASSQTEQNALIFLFCESLFINNEI